MSKSDRPASSAFTPTTTEHAACAGDAAAAYHEGHTAALRKVSDVVASWAALTEWNPDARILGGPRSRRLWEALDALQEDV
jgi:hypothetical protein